MATLNKSSRIFMLTKNIFSGQNFRKPHHSLFFHLKVFPCFSNSCGNPCLCESQMYDLLNKNYLKNHARKQSFLLLSVSLKIPVTHSTILCLLADQLGIEDTALQYLRIYKNYQIKSTYILNNAKKSKLTNIFMNASYELC